MLLCTFSFYLKIDLKLIYTYAILNFYITKTQSNQVMITTMDGRDDAGESRKIGNLHLFRFYIDIIKYAFYIYNLYYYYTKIMLAAVWGK